MALDIKGNKYHLNLHFFLCSPKRWKILFTVVNVESLSKAELCKSCDESKLTRNKLCYRSM